ncbi:hypothetical protein [Ancylobacter rudongensis]|uniref:Uncharacterized protein n=1 Tax=Ancylobacter rudongensis TaxID=177413 RepID=A0A1G4UR25_9HYPH|nr:hypothetical protein [Ancylobacter rudongensis]SCW95425.1 hypothetical protein SAMN05660859_0025 [Ancylobacter rudongensis]
MTAFRGSVLTVETLREIERSMAASLERAYYVEPMRLWGKSVAPLTQSIAGIDTAFRSADSALRGMSAQLVLEDELAGYRPRRSISPAASFSDPHLAGTKVELFLEEMGKRDPRHPNPKAGPIQIVTLMVNGERRPAGQMSMKRAVNLAKATHLRLVKDAKARLAANNPNYGRF